MKKLIIAVNCETGYREKTIVNLTMESYRKTIITLCSTIPLFWRVTLKKDGVVLRDSGECGFPTYHMCLKLWNEY